MAVVTLPADTDVVGAAVDDEVALAEDSALVVDVDVVELEELPVDPKEAEIPVELVQPDGTEAGPPATKWIAAHWMPFSLSDQVWSISSGSIRASEI